MSEISDQIATAAPKSVTIDGNTATAHSLRDQIEAAKYLESKAAVADGNLGIRFTTFNRPGVS